MQRKSGRRPRRQNRRESFSCYARTSDAVGRGKNSRASFCPLHSGQEPSFRSHHFSTACPLGHGWRCTERATVTHRRALPRFAAFPTPKNRTRWQSVQLALAAVRCERAQRRTPAAASLLKRTAKTRREKSGWHRQAEAKEQDQEPRAKPTSGTPTTSSSGVAHLATKPRGGQKHAAGRCIMPKTTGYA